MKFYAKDRDKILIYSYVPNKNKMYDFKKREIESEKEGPHWVSASIDTKKKYYSGGGLEIKSTDIKDAGWFYESESSISEERKKELLEAYYKASANDYYIEKSIMTSKPATSFVLHTDDSTVNIDIDNKGIILPPSINAKIDKDIPNSGYTNEAIVINESLIMLETIQLGFIYFDDDREYDLINNTDVLKCFEFSQEDEFNISALEILYKDETWHKRADFHEPKTNIFQYTLNMANKGARIINRVNQLKR